MMRIHTCFFTLLLISLHIFVLIKGDQDTADTEKEENIIVRE